MKKLMFIVVLFIASNSLFSQEYEIAWEKDIGGSFAQFSKDGEFIYVAGGNTISKYRSSDGSFVSKFDGTGFIKNDIPIYGIFYLSGLGNYLTVCTDRFSIWDTRTEKGVRQIQKINCMDISADEKYLIIADKYSIFKTAFNDSIVIKSKSINEDVIILRVSHNGKMFATASIYTDNQKNKNFYLTLWNTDSITEVKRFPLNDFAQGAEFKDIKFSWDDKFVGVRSFDPHHVNIFDITNLNLLINSKEITPLGCGTFDFTSDNKNILFTYNNFNNEDYNTFFVDIISLKLKDNKKIFSYPLNTSSNNLIFTGKALLKPKTVGVAENEQNRFSISPNPAGDFIEIPLDSPSIKRGLGDALSLSKWGVSLEIYNIFGEPQETPPLPSASSGTGINIDVSNLVPGVYFIKIGNKFEKFVKM
jgi:hypothetical protein